MSAGTKRNSRKSGPAAKETAAKDDSRQKKRGHVGARQGPARGRRTAAAFKPGVRARGAKIGNAVARWIRAGHPWIFRDALLRPLEGFGPGAVVADADEDGNHIGHALYEPEGAVALRMVSRALEFEWNAETMLARLEMAKAHRDRYIEP
ncbi:MAG: hypothetical protein KC431_15315, partial [Myxococcales bacterium]|nr:hypothetical protein [Myxococcales bacterium]